MNHSEIEENLKFARERFGDMILHWRKRYGWTGRTWEGWADACPDVLPISVVNSVITGLELKRNARTAPSTFIAFGMANEALAREERGTIADRTLHDRVYAAEPIRHPDGRPWGPPDFFSAYTGFLAIPEELLTPEPTGTASVDELRDRFRQLRSNMAPRTALDTMLGFEPRISRQDRDQIEELVFGMSDEATAETLALIQRLLDRWERNA